MEIQMYTNIKFEIENQICVLTINRPDKLNALNNTTLDEIESAFIKIYNDKSIRAVIITGEGTKAFVAGADISEISELTEVNGRKFAERGQEIFQQIESCHKPVIAAINGYALGGGCELALACHLRIGSMNAKLGLPEVSLGILPGFGGTQRLTQLIGKGRAMELILSGKMIDSDTAYKFGLLNQVCQSHDELLTLSFDLANKIIQNAPVSIAMSIESVNAATDYEKNGYQVEANSFLRCLTTKDFEEGTLAFLEKRKPIFTGE